MQKWIKSPLSGPERTFTFACTADVDINKFNGLLILDNFQLQSHAFMTCCLISSHHASPPLSPETPSQPSSFNVEQMPLSHFPSPLASYPQKFWKWH